MGNQGCQENYDKFNQGWRSHPNMGQDGPFIRYQQQQPSLHER